MQLPCTWNRLSPWDQDQPFGQVSVSPAPLGKDWTEASAGHFDAAQASGSGSMLGADLGSIVSGSEASITQPSESKSLGLSSPRTAMDPNLPDMRRQRGRVRRDSKLSVRIHRADSSSYTTSPPMSMGEASNSLGLPLYAAASSSSASSSMPMMAAPATTLGGPSFMQQYNLALPDQTPSSQVFASTYQQQAL